MPSGLPGPSGLERCLEPFGLEAHGAGRVCETSVLLPLWYHVTEVAWLEACVSLATFPGRVGADARFSVYFSKSTRGTPCRPASPGGRGLCSQEQRRGCQVLRKYLRHRVHAGPHTLAHSPACSFNMGEAGLSVLAESSHWSPFWQRMGSVHQDHIPDAGTEILDG